MSYDVTLTVDVGGPERLDLQLLRVNYTYNCGKMLVEAAGVSLSEMNGWDADRAADTLTAAIAAMDADPTKYDAMNPANGWGNATGWRRFLEAIRDACTVAPNAFLDVH